MDIISEAPKKQEKCGKMLKYFAFLKRRYSNKYGFDPQTNNF